MKEFRYFSCKKSLHCAIRTYTSLHQRIWVKSETFYDQKLNNYSLFNKSKVETAQYTLGFWPIYRHFVFRIIGRCFCSMFFGSRRIFVKWAINISFIASSGVTCQINFWQIGRHSVYTIRIIGRCFCRMFFGNRRVFFKRAINVPFIASSGVTCRIDFWPICSHSG